jgi:hypothetical protein
MTSAMNSRNRIQNTGDRRQKKKSAKRRKNSIQKPLELTICDLLLTIVLASW